MEKQLMDRLAKSLQVTSSDLEPEPYILTSEEENDCINHAIEKAKSLYSWKQDQLKIPEVKKKERLSKMNWELKINRTKILKDANASKHYQIWQKEKRQEEKEQEQKLKQALIDKWNANYFFKFMSLTSKYEFGKKLIVNQYNSDFITAVCFFLSRDERFETELGYSLKKGLLIRGISGIGKTHIVKCVANNELHPVFVVSTIEITDEVKNNGEYNLPIVPNGCIYLDDLGTEQPTVKFFGTAISWFKDYIEMAYLDNASFNNILISTNNSAQDFEDKYGFRVRSRIREMFNVIDVKGKDMRV